MRIAAVLCLLIGLAAGAPAALAQDELKIAAVVNDDVITQLDVFARLRAAMLSARLQDTPENRQNLLPNVMRSLIDDHLKAQEAKAQGVTVGDAEVNARIANLASRNNMSREDFDAIYKQLRKLPLKERRRLPGLDPDRADQIAAGAAVVDHLFDKLAFTHIDVCDRALREGMIIDYMHTHWP